MDKEKIKSIIKAFKVDIIEYPFNPEEHKSGSVILQENIGKASINSIIACCDTYQFFEIRRKEVRFFNHKTK